MHGFGGVSVAIAMDGGFLVCGGLVSIMLRWEGSIVEWR